MEFEWDDAKARINARRHGLSSDEASTVFHNALARIFPDTDHSNGEICEIIVGHSALDRLLIASFTERATSRVRIMHAGLRGGKGRIMKKESVPKKRRERGVEDLRPEYRFDYAKATPNRFAGRARKDTVVVLLAPDVARVFKDGASVNAVLRAVINAFPPPTFQ